MSFVEPVMAATGLHLLEVRMKVLGTEGQVLLNALKGILKKGL